MAIFVLNYCLREFLFSEIANRFELRCESKQLMLPIESKKHLAFENILLPEYQSNEIENCLVLSPICQIRLSNLPGFNRSFLSVEIGDFLQKAPFENLPKGVKTPSKTSLCSSS